MRIKDLKRILFIDIETVSTHASYDQLTPVMQKHWLRKAKQIKSNATFDNDQQRAHQLYFDKAGIFAEFSKVVCISVGVLSTKSDKIKSLRLRSYFGHDEKELLTSFANVLNKHFNRTNRYFLCGHNLREFDVPFICRRMLLNGIKLPALINIPGKRPWQTPHLIDTLEYWKFGDYKNYTSLDLLTNIFGLPTPKDDLDGSLVGNAYWVNNDIDAITTYCEKDVISVVQLYLKFNGLPLVEENQILSTTNSSSYDEEE